MFRPTSGKESVLSSSERRATFPGHGHGGAGIGFTISTGPAVCSETPSRLRSGQGCETLTKIMPATN